MKIIKYCSMAVNIIHKCSNVLVWAAAIGLFIMAILTSIDVVFRYIFNRPIKGTQEVVELLMALAVYCGLPYATFRRKHIIVDTFLGLMPKSIQNILLGICSLLCTAASIVISYKLGEYGFKIIDQPNISTTTIKIQLWPFYLLTSVGCGFLSLEFFFDCIKRFVEAAIGDKEQNLQIQSGIEG